jgi:hypothetical protein
MKTLAIIKGLTLAKTITIVALITLMSACSSMLPAGETRQGNGWSSFENARDLFVKIHPYESHRQDVHAMGLDPFENPSVSLLSYSDLVQRFGTGNVLRADQLERGIRECMEGGKRCTGYQLNQREVKQKRVGNAFLDLFNFRRETQAYGWSFNGTIVFVDDGVVMTLYGGQPLIHETTLQTNPLGPLQSLPERAGQGVIKP